MKPTWTLIAALLAAPAFAQDDDEFLDVDEEEVTRPRVSWPAEVRLDRANDKITFVWPTSTGQPFEELAFSNAIRLERARAYENEPDELFLLLSDGRRVLVSRGDDVNTHALMVPALTQLPLAELTPGTGHSVGVANAARPPPRLSTGAKGGFAIRAVTGESLREKRTVSLPTGGEGQAEDPAFADEGGGELDRQDIGRAIKMGMSGVRRCYEHQLQRNPGLEGKVTVRFAIDLDGSVKLARLKESSIHNKPVEDCVVAEVASLRFPKPRGSGTVVVAYPFHFSPG